MTAFDSRAHTPHIAEAAAAGARLTRCIAASEPLQRLQAQLERSHRVAVSGLVGAGRAAAVSALAEVTGRLLVWIVPDDDAFDAALTELGALAGDRLLPLPRRDSRPYQWAVPAAELVSQRLATLTRLATKPAPGAIVLTTLDAWFDATLPPRELRRRCIVLAVDEDRSREDLLTLLSGYGYLRSEVVEEVGQYAVRGGIVDLFPTSLERPLRVEFWDDRVASLRQFDVGTQRTLQKLECAEIWPQRETAADASDLDIWTATLPRAAQEQLEMHRDPAAEPPGLEWLFSALQVEAASVAAYLPDDALLWLSEPEALAEREEDMRAALQQDFERVGTEIEALPAPDRVLPDARRAEAQWEPFVQVHERQLGRSRGINFGMKAHPAVHGNLPLVSSTVARFDHAFLWGPARGQLAHAYELLDEPETLQLCRGALIEGFEYEKGSVLCLTEHELFARRPRARVARRFREGVALSSYTALKKGDFVVHVDFGVGRYHGLKALDVAGQECDLLELHYADQDKVFVPVEAFNRVRKFAGAQGEPQLSKLGSGAWDKIKSRTRRKILAMAQELVRLYAARKAQPGFAFGPDDEWMRQLEETFPYEETPDQTAALAAIKADMEAAAPMDRLVCGDVGFGKTELAIRAALKAIAAGKQVAVLVPTTILAQQHIETFTDRLSAFPVRVEMLSRFRSAMQQRHTIEALAQGRIDVVIGTHRLLSKDVAFRDLGLLVVDEEHRFGVRHKERIKQLRNLVDCLTLTATPIPRTLQMSLLGARDLSVINTPPAGRLSVHTEIVPLSDAVITSAVTREVERGGQVFIVHNRVQSIGAVYRYLKVLLPTLDMVIAHGQMKESELERVMLEFTHRKHQILLSTAIIESGLDIPQVNTILIHRAHTFGLAQLYQLRGRVGRSKRQAYAYLLVPPAGALSVTARRRLAAVEQHSDLGSGFHLAMRDLEIRGSGNLLGAEQHGFIQAVGFDLYTQLVEEAVAEVKGEKPPEPSPVKLETPQPLRLPEAYVPQASLRVDLYQRLADAQTPKAVEALRQEAEDRFGPLPETARDLFDAAVCRLVWGRLGVTRVRLAGAVALWEWGPGQTPDRALLERIAARMAEPHRYTWGKTLSMNIAWGDREPLRRFRKLLQDLWEES